MHFFTAIILSTLASIVCASPIPDPGQCKWNCGYKNWWSSASSTVTSTTITTGGGATTSSVATVTSSGGGYTTSPPAVTTGSSTITASTSSSAASPSGSGSMASNPPSGTQGNNNVLFENRNSATGYYIMWDPAPPFGQGQYVAAGSSWRSPDLAGQYSPNIRVYDEAFYTTHTPDTGNPAVWAEATFADSSGLNWLDVSAEKCQNCQNGVHWMVAESNSGIYSGCSTIEPSCQNDPNGAYVASSEGTNTRASFTGSIKVVVCGSACDL